ncbi:MAG: DNRLRE domain-containing protein, partial [Actinomycetota bacterium]|nr:DNRLRE domain-containing protein [Actinomycetota bacterium]
MITTAKHTSGKSSGGFALPMVVGFGRPSRLVAGIATVAVATSAFITASEVVKPPVAHASTSYPTSAPSEPAAMQTAQASGHKVLVDSLTTETDQVWANPTGTLTRESALGVVRKRQEDGSWADVDLTLARGSNSVSSAVPAVPVTYGAAGSSTVAATVLDGERVSVGWEAPLPEPVLNGARATYPEVRPGVDLVAEAIRSGFEVSFLVKAQPLVALSLPLSLTLPTGWSASQGADGALTINNAAGTVTGHAAAPVVFGAARDASSNLPSMSQAVPDVLGQATTASGGATTRVWTLTPSPSFFADPRVTYPVTVDPVYSWAASSDSYVRSDLVTSQYTATRLYIGTNDGGITKARALVHLDTIPGVFAGKHVTSASLQLFNSYSASCYVGPLAPINLWRSNTWTSSTLWATQPAGIDLQSTSQFTHAAPNGCGGPAAYDNLDLTAVAQGWAAGTVATKDFKILSSETDTRGWKEFYSVDAGSNPPKFSVTYNTVPTKAVGQYIAPCSVQCADPAVTKSAQPLTYATADDVDGGGLVFNFEYWAGSSPNPSNMVATGSGSGPPNSSVSGYPTTALADGSYEYRARAYDGVDYGTWSDWFHFTVDTVAPAVGSLTGTWPRNAWSAASSGTFTWTAGDVSVNSYRYALDGGPATSVPAATVQASLSGVADGWHTFTLSAFDIAGNQTNYTSYVFGIGNGAITSPAIGDRASDSVTLTSQAPSGSYPYVRFQWAQGSSPAPAWQTIGFGSLLTPGTSTPATVTANSTYPVNAALTWKAIDQLRVGALEVRACFAVDANSAPTTCSGPNTFQTVPAAFGPTYATAPVGPGSLALQTGDLAINATDVSVASYDGQLTIGRTLTTLDPANTRGQLLTGPQHDIETDLTSFTTNFSTLSSATTPTTLGSRSLKVAPNGDASATTDTFTSPGGDIGALRLGLQGGHSYTLSGWEYVPSSTGLVPDQATRGLRPVAFTRVGTAGYVETTGTAPTTVNAWNPVSVTFRVPAGATEAFIRLYNGFSSTKTGSAVYYDNLTLARTDVFGPGWTSALPGPDAGAGDLALEDDSAQGYVLLTGSDGSASMYLQDGTGSTFSGTGDAADGGVLTKVSSTRFTLTDTDGTGTTWTSPSSGVWQVLSVVEPGDAHTTSYSYDADGRAIQILGPIPPGVTCASPLTTVGCRTLTLTYAPSTTATGTSSATWGDYSGQLKSVSFTAADPLNGNTMTTTAVASYLYDNTGRLRTAWDPRLSTPLKTVY